MANPCHEETLMKAVIGIAVIMIGSVTTSLHAASYCGELTEAYGPSGGDYTNSADKAKMKVVEDHHFTPEVEKLISGKSGYLGSDINYTLERFPNHHRALAAIAKLGLRDKTTKPRGAKYSVGCFFDRAIQFKPNDITVRAIYSNYLLKLGQTDKALEQLKGALELQPENPTINYNLGLLYVEKKDYEQARTYAKKAYELGFPLPGLKDKLVKAGKWED